MIDDPNTAMPHALGAEKAIISLLLQNSSANYSKFQDAGMTFEMFYSPSHIKIAGIILEYIIAGHEIEMISLVQKLIDKSLLSDLGGPSAITELFGYAPISSDFVRFCEVIKTKYIERELRKLCYSIESSEPQDRSDIQLILNESESKLSSLSSVLHQKADTSVRSAVQSTFERFGALISTDDPKSLYGLLTGFDELDDMLMGLQPQCLYVIGARPSVGKSSYMMNIIESVCAHQGHPTTVFSLEMSREQLIDKMIYSMAKINYHNLKIRGAGRYIPSKSELIRMKDAAIRVERAPLHIDEKSGISIDYMMATARRHKRDYGTKMIAIDYLQLMKSMSKKASQSKVVEIGEITGACKEIAKELKIPVLLLSQLSRDSVKGNKIAKPKMSDLRSSGDIEQDADAIMLLHRYDYEGRGDEKDKGRAEVDLAKNRNGPTGCVELMWTPEYTRFSERLTQY